MCRWLVGEKDVLQQLERYRSSQVLRLEGLQADARESPADLLLMQVGRRPDHANRCLPVFHEQPAWRPHRVPTAVALPLLAAPCSFACVVFRRSLTSPGWSPTLCPHP